MPTDDQSSTIPQLESQISELNLELGRMLERLDQIRGTIAALQSRGAEATPPAAERAPEAVEATAEVAWFQSGLPAAAPEAPAGKISVPRQGWLSSLSHWHAERWVGFDEDAYAFYNPDVAAAVAGGTFSSCYEHYLMHGRAEKRSGGPGLKIRRRDLSPEALGQHPYGVNHYSFLGSVSGLGTAARSLQAALEAAHIPLQSFELPNWEDTGRPKPELRGGPYRVNLIHQNADVLHLFADAYGQELLAGRYNIEHAVWEMPSLRSDWARSLGLLDEIWVPTEFCRRAFAASTTLPVTTIPYSIDQLELQATLKRQDLGLPVDGFLFSTVFDVSSGFLRKNPLAVIDAFRRAFGDSRQVLLVLKCFNSHYAPERLAELRDRAAAPNIRLLDERWNDAQIHSLHRISDCLVSAHRAEGFGLNLAETMYFGNAVIGTAYGAVTDFMTPENSYLLDYKPVEIESTVGPYLKGNIWAEASVDHLAELMRRVYTDTAERKAKGERAQADIRANYSAKAVGARIERRLTELGLHESRPAARTFPVHPAGPPRLSPRGVPAEVRREIRAMARRPPISVVMPVYNVAGEWLRRAIESVKAQWYPFWELCLCDDASTSEETRRVLAEYQGSDPRIRIDRAESNTGIAGASNRAALLASGEFIALLDNDDELTRDALLEVVRRLNRQPELDLIYSDEDKLNEAGEICDPFFKPDWSPEHLQSVMYLLHLLVVRKRTFFEVGGFREQFSGAQDYDLALRVAGRTARIGHIPKVLYHWRMIPGSAAEKVDAKPAALEAGLRALEDFVAREKLPARVEPGLLQGQFRVRYNVVGHPKVALCIVASNKKAQVGSRGYINLLENFVRSIEEKTEYRNREVVVVHDDNLEAGCVRALAELRCRMVCYPGPYRPFNFARKANFALRHAHSEHVVLLNDDMEVIRPDWLSALLEYSQQSRIGAVGGRLLHADGSIQHAGMAVGVNEGAAHLFHRAPRGYVGYNGFTHVVRNYSAVTAACLATRMQVFEEVGGFDEQFSVDFNDTDFCLSLLQRGYRVVYTPYCELYHFEGQSLTRQAQNAREVERFQTRWAKFLESDPYYNPNLTRTGLDCAVDPERSTWRPGRPVA